MKKVFLILFLIIPIFVYSENKINLSAFANKQSNDGIKKLLEFNPSNLKEVRTYIREHFVYKLEDSDHWSAPTELMRNGYGDCEDFAIFLMYYASRLGYPVTMIIVETTEGTYHALCTINGKLFEPQSVEPRTLGKDKPIKQLTLEECLDQCYF